MSKTLHHELLYRGADVLARLAALRLTICGVGAIGSNLADNLVRQGARKVRAIDHDRVEAHNVSTQLYGESDVGVWKVETLRNRLFRAAGVEIDAVRKELTNGNSRQLLGEADLLIDAFDNAASRQLVQDLARASGVACLHVGLHTDYCEIIWDETYRVPRDQAGDPCEQPLARNLVLLATAIATETVVRFVQSGERISRTCTLEDFMVTLVEN